MKLLMINSEQMLKNMEHKPFRKFMDNSLLVVVSDNLKSNESNDRIITMPALMPAPVMIQTWQSKDIVKFNSLYYKYLQAPAVSVIISTLFNLAAEENINIVFLCSKMEDEYSYLELLGNYCQAVYNIEPVSLKKLVKGKDIEDYDVKPSEIQEVCDDRFARAMEAVPNVIEVVKEQFGVKSKKDKKKKKKKK